MSKTTIASFKSDHPCYREQLEWAAEDAVNNLKAKGYTIGRRVTNTATLIEYEVTEPVSPP